MNRSRKSKLYVLTGIVGGFLFLSTLLFVFTSDREGSGVLMLVGLCCTSFSLFLMSTHTKENACPGQLENKHAKF